MAGSRKRIPQFNFATHVFDQFKRRKVDKTDEIPQQEANVLESTDSSQDQNSKKQEIHIVENESTNSSQEQNSKSKNEPAPQIDHSEVIKHMNESFSNKKENLHSFYTCKTCTKLSYNETQRLKTKDDRFQHNWITDESLTYCQKTGYNWLIYIEGEGMFCLICRKHDSTNSINKAKKFNAEPGVRFKRKALQDHSNGQQHKSSVLAELIKRSSPFLAELDKRESSKQSVYYNAFLAIYWLAKEEIANCKAPSLLQVLQQLGLDDIKYFQHRSAGSFRSIMLMLGENIKSQVAKKCEEAKYFGLLCDEVCDLANKEQLLTFVNYVDKDTHKVCTDFLSATDLLEKSDSADAHTIWMALSRQLEDCNLKKSSLSSFASDGASP
ncbi:uncharacterized protein LOC110243833 [Exaiptasia diaphana]|uniref:C17orf113 probable zinc finger domain-containing protein n=1 Tax=Exaiptasia diaphana TaxID=2652724 RepID=A0A913YM97_EXADI|nr:uncharacterized protein LOC110243833 [Exaiptasia diaphana]